MKRYLYIFLSMALLLISDGAQAFWGLAIDSFPMPDFVDEAASYIQSTADLANNTQKTIKTTEDNLNNLKTAALSVYSGELNTLVDNHSINPGQKPMETCMYLGKQYKNDSADNVYDLVKVLLLQYPSNDTLEKEKYDNYREEFYKDTVIEVFTAAEQIEEDLKNRIQVSIDESIECIKGNVNSCGTPPPAGNNDAVFLEGEAFKAVDNLYETLLKVTALKAQFIAAQAIYKNQALPYVEGVENQTADTSGAAEAASAENSEGQASQAETQASVTKLGKVYASANLHKTETMAFAQIGMLEADTNSLSRVESAVTLSKDTGQGYVDGALTFVVPEESPLAHAYVYEEDKMAELDKIEPAETEVNKARDVHNLIHGLSDYKNAAESVQEMREKYEKALASLKKADSCAEAYIGRHFKDAEKVWGRATDVTDSDSRTGISGWAYKAYEAAKAAETTTASSGDVVAMNIDYDEVEISSPMDTEKNLSIITNQGSVSPGKSKEEKSAEEARASQMISWQIGAEASKMLAGSPSDWGEGLQHPAFPVWQDVKSFYDQYLDKKYNNIKKYLRSFSKNDVLAVVVDRLKGGDAEVDDTLRRQEAAMVESQLSAEISDVDKAGLEAISGYEGAYQGRLQAFQAQRDALISRMDQLSSQLKEDSDKLSDLRNQAQEGAAEEMREKVTAQDVFPAGVGGEPSESITLLTVEDNDDISTNFSARTTSQKKDSNLEDLEQRVSTTKQEIASLEEDLERLDKEIKTYKLQAQSGISEVNLSAEAEKNELSEQAQDIISEANKKYEQDVKSNLLEVLKTYPIREEVGLIITPESVYNELASSAENALEQLYKQVDARVDQARKEISALGDNLYDPAYHSQIDKIHQKMIEDIKLLAISVSAKGIPSITGIELYTKLLLADTTAETEDYFVGRPEKARDIKAPKAIFAENLPPMREMFHFDEVDFENVKPFVDGQTESLSIIKSDFLNVGGEIPLVWQYMLRPHAYVEADIDLQEALDKGCPQVSFFRGGAMPCRIKDTAIVMDMDAEGRYIRSSATGALPECAYLEARTAGIYHTQRQVMIDPKSEGETVPANCNYSELGTLFEAEGVGNMRFREPTYIAYYSLLKEINKPEENLSTSDKQKLAGYDRTPLAFNQIGEFLVYAENERNIKEQLNDAENQYKKMEEDLFGTLREYGYEPSANLDLAKEEDYQLVRGELDKIKNLLISESQGQLDAIDVADNDVVAERVESLRKVISALQKDKDEETIISSAVEDQNNLDEEIKSSKVNEEVADKFVESINKASASTNLPESPYCAVY